MFARLLSALLCIASVAMILLVIGFLAIQLGLNWLTVLLYAFAGKVLLMVFALLFILGILAACFHITNDIRQFFVQEARARRQVLAKQNQKLHLLSLSWFKNQQLFYFNQFKRQRLLAKDDKKQLQALYQAIQQELSSAKPRTTLPQYQAWRKALRQHLKHADANAMLALRELINHVAD